MKYSTLITALNNLPSAADTEIRVRFDDTNSDKEHNVIGVATEIDKETKKKTFVLLIDSD
jgi:hypothetical protein